jgi:4-hydroxy-tetrahydrodipicolinate synthase
VTASFRLEGVLSVLPTSFRDDGSLDLPGIESLVVAHLASGVAGLTVLGVMGEAAELTDEERDAVLDCVIGATARSVPVIVGVSGSAAEVVAARSREAAERGVGALMVSPTDSVDLTAAVAAAARSGLPIVIQDYRLGSGVELTSGDLADVAEREPLVTGIKAESPPTSGTIAALHRRCPWLGLVGGLGGLFLIDELRAGATGTMTGFALPASLASIVSTFPVDPARAETQWTALLPLMRFEGFPPFSLAARKEVWRLRGVIGSAHCRRAGAFLDDQARQDIRLALERVAATLGQRLDLIPT